VDGLFGSNRSRGADAFENDLAGAMYVKHQTFAIAYYGASALLIIDADLPAAL
jgi:hypothetical protein